MKEWQDNQWKEKVVRETRGSVVFCLSKGKVKRGLQDAHTAGLNFQFL